MSVYNNNNLTINGCVAVTANHFGPCCFSAGSSPLCTKHLNAIRHRETRNMSPIEVWKELVTYREKFYDMSKIYQWYRLGLVNIVSKTDLNVIDLSSDYEESSEEEEDEEEYVSDYEESFDEEYSSDEEDDDDEKEDDEDDEEKNEENEEEDRDISRLFSLNMQGGFMTREHALEHALKTIRKTSERALNWRSYRKNSKSKFSKNLQRQQSDRKLNIWKRRHA